MQQTDFYQSFKAGDLVYGLNTHRASYAAAVSSKEELSGYSFLTADSYNNIIIPKVIKIDLDTDEIEFNAEGVQELSTDPALQDHFKFLLEPQKYVKQLRLEKYSLQDKDVKEAFGAEGSVYLKACKLAIFKPNTTIHFCLDGIDTGAAFAGDTTTKIYKSYTSAELRFIKKHWELLKDKVVFYSGMAKTHAPWEAVELQTQAGDKTPPRSSVAASYHSVPSRHAFFDTARISKPTRERRTRQIMADTVAAALVLALEGAQTPPPSP